MSNINYEAEVKKVYPDAKCHIAHLTANKAIYSKIAEQWLSDSCAFEDEAWQSAYENLKQQRKIK